MGPLPRHAVPASRRRGRGRLTTGDPVLAATRERLVARFGARVDGWWESLPELLDGLAARWDAVVGAPVGSGNTSLVLRCTQAGRAAILKLSPDPELTRAEARALRAWAPSGRVPVVLAADAAAGALLLEAIPGETPLAVRPGAVTVGDVAALIARLHAAGAAAGGGYGPGVGGLGERIEWVFDHWARRVERSPGARGAVPAARLERGRELARGLAASGPATPVLLHGDLHSGNVLDGGPVRGLVAIDPRPCLGDPAVDAVDWVFWRAEDPGQWVVRRDELAAALGVDGERLWQWCRAFAAMLAAATAMGSGPAERVAALLALAP